MQDGPVLIDSGNCLFDAFSQALRQTRYRGQLPINSEELRVKAVRTIGQRGNADEYIPSLVQAIAASRHVRRGCVSVANR